ncbi:hypothetical protein Neosp_001330 [[Neocosmospora] mangrovei]
MSLTRDTFIYRGALVIGLLPSFFGLNSLLRPEGSLKSVEFPVPTDPESRKLVFGLMRIYGIRNVVVSFTLTLIWLTGNKRMLGLGLDGLLPYIYTLPMEYIDDKVKVKKELDKIYGDIFLMAEEINGNFVVKSEKPGPANLMAKLQDVGAMRKEARIIIKKD